MLLLRIPSVSAGFEGGLGQPAIRETEREICMHVDIYI